MAETYGYAKRGAGYGYGKIRASTRDPPRTPRGCAGGDRVQPHPGRRRVDTRGRLL
jgi:hypothetical protein